MFRWMENPRDVLYFLSRKQYMKKVWSRGEIYQFCVNTRSFPTLLGKRKQSIVKKLTKFDGCFHENIPDRFESLRQLYKLWIFSTICASTEPPQESQCCSQLTFFVLLSYVQTNTPSHSLFFFLWGQISHPIICCVLYIKINITMVHHS